MSHRIKAIWGASGYGRETMAWLTSVVDSDSQCVFVDDSVNLSPVVNGHKAYRFDDFLNLRAESKEIVIAVGDPAIRRELANRASASGVQLFTAVAPTAFLGTGVHVGRGTIIGPQVIVTADARIGDHVHLNINCYIAHDCVVENFVTVGPGVGCNGNVHLHEGAYLGAKCVIRQGRPGQPTVIGRGAIVGMGSVVLRDVPPDVTVVGNPARSR